MCTWICKVLDFRNIKKLFSLALLQLGKGSIICVHPAAHLHLVELVTEQAGSGRVTSGERFVLLTPQPPSHPFGQRSPPHAWVSSWADLNSTLVTFNY